MGRLFDEDTLDDLADYWDSERIIKTVLWLIFFIGLTVFSIKTISAYQKSVIYNAEIEAKLADIKVLQSDIKAIETVDIPEDESFSAMQPGNDIAVLQTNLAKFQMSVDDGIDYNAQEMLDEEIAKLKPYFSDGKGISNWYFCRQSHYEWHFDTIWASFSDKIPVVWTCRQTGTNANSNPVLAYATAVYDANNKTFSGLDFHITAVGTKLREADALVDGGRGQTSSSTPTDATETSTTTDATETDGSTETTEVSSGSDNGEYDEVYTEENEDGSVTTYKYKYD